MTTTKRRYIAALDSSQKELAATSQTTRDFTASIKAILEHPRFKASVTASVHQRITADGFVSLCPSISVGLVREDDSPIFGFVSSGDIDGLLSLLSQGKASLRDCDLFGAPLLHVSGTRLKSVGFSCLLLQYAIGQPRMCEFLIENGADVDEIALEPRYRRIFSYVKFMLGQ